MKDKFFWTAVTPSDTLALPDHLLVYLVVEPMCAPVQFFRLHAVTPPPGPHIYPYHPLLPVFPRYVTPFCFQSRGGASDLDRHE
jgi:hypothetical protein